MDVIVMDTAASLNVSDILSGTGACNDVLRQAPSITNVSSIPIPSIKNGAAKLIPINGIPQYITRPQAEIVAKTAEKMPKSPKNGLDLTQSVIMQVTMQKAIITPKFREK